MSNLNLEMIHTRHLAAMHDISCMWRDLARIQRKSATIALWATLGFSGLNLIPLLVNVAIPGQVHWVGLGLSVLAIWLYSEASKSECTARQTDLDRMRAEMDYAVWRCQDESFA